MWHLQDVLKFGQSSVMESKARNQSLEPAWYDYVEAKCFEAELIKAMTESTSGGWEIARTCAAASRLTRLHDSSLDP